MDRNRHSVFVTGGTGYLGRPLIQRLLAQGREVRALVRLGSENKLPSGCKVISGDALDTSSYISKISPADTFVQLVGVAHPSKWLLRLLRRWKILAAVAASRKCRKSAPRAGFDLSAMSNFYLSKGVFSLRRLR